MAELREYEQARDLTIDLLKRWLENINLKLTKHETTPALLGKPVTQEEKKREQKILQKNLEIHQNGNLTQGPIN